LIKVLLVDDHDLIRRGVRSLLVQKPGIEIVGEAGTGEEAIAFVKKEKVDIILMDIQMPGIGGLEATRRIAICSPDTRVIAMTVYAGQPYPARFLEAGAMGYLTKGCNAEEIIKAVHAVYNGHRYINAEVAQQIALHSFEKGKQYSTDKLSDRELNVMMMIVHGKHAADIAKDLHVELKTVNTYRYRIFEKLDVHSDVELTLLAMRLGMIENTYSLTLQDTPMLAS